MARRAAGLLRMPPFPRAGAGGGCLDAGPGPAPTSIDPARAHAIAAALVSARVGGAFWGRQLDGRQRLVLAGDAVDVPAGDLGDAVVLANGQAARLARRRGAVVAAPGDVDPWPLIEAAGTIIAPAGSEIGLLALAAGKPPRLAGIDPAPPDREPLARALLERRYRDPSSGGTIEVEDAIKLLAAWRTLIDGNRGLSAATGMAFWKRPEVARLLWDGRPSRLPFRGARAALARARREGGAVAAWPARVPADFAERAAAVGVPVRWVEDGFLRSAGLGSDLLPPLSLTVDDCWPYFDPDRPSRLERLLEACPVDAALLARAAALRAAIVARRIGKYHVGAGTAAVAAPPDARLVLAVGQVEDDLSVLRGGGGMTNLALIERARAAEPDAYIVYRPHPDVEAGHRRGRVSEAAALAMADRIDRGTSLDSLLARAEAVHTITSLTGFEALMRDKRVVVHGAPFYAGWGLTDDRGPVPTRRTRRLTLDQLVAATLILYPRYLDARHRLPCSPERFIGSLEGVGVHAGWLVRLRRWQGRLRHLARG